ncbi:MAG: hypothetical protein COB51_05475 [Moraxellaceae bacterium]|nr:MAG: hypothetical protein COB51_05475 [Moraxellaceae bacterium]
MNKNTLLIESLRYDATQKKLHRLDQHMKRLRASAQILFEIRLHENKLRQAIQQTLHKLLRDIEHHNIEHHNIEHHNIEHSELQPQSRATQTGLYKIRITLDFKGAFQITSSPLPSRQEAIHICISDQEIDSENIFQRHKTTQRNLYNSERQRVQPQGFHDVVFFNQKGELAEASIHNVFILQNGIYYTPPLACGALPGVMRHCLLKNHPNLYKERIITQAEFLHAENIRLTNSVVEILQANILIA